MQSDDQHYQEAVLVLPRLRVQNANAISSPMTWGFPAVTAFLGTMHSLARRLPARGMEFRGVGVICHDFEAQITEGGYTRAFRLTRNPVDRFGETAGIVEEGRIHLDISLVFLVNLAEPNWGQAARQQLAEECDEIVAEMRIAGGSVLPRLPDGSRHSPRPQLRVLPTAESDRRDHFRRMMRRWLPGFALVSREDLLRDHLVKLQESNAGATVLDAWLDLSRLNRRAKRTALPDDQTGEPREAVEWMTERHDGWIVPIPVGYAGLSELYAAGSVASVRDEKTPFRFVESIYSMGQWISPHRLTDMNDFLWYPQYVEGLQLYRCCNDFSSPTTVVATDID